jgi:hypothetical protein
MKHKSNLAPEKIQRDQFRNIEPSPEKKRMTVTFREDLDKEETKAKEMVKQSVSPSLLNEPILEDDSVSNGSEGEEKTRHNISSPLQTNFHG